MVEQSLGQKVNGVEVNTITCHITCGLSRDFNLESQNIILFYIDKSIFLF